MLKIYRIVLISVLLCCYQIQCETNLPPSFTKVLDNIVLSENTPVGTVVYKLEAIDPEGSRVSFGAVGSDHFSVDSESGNITLIKPLDREEKETLTFLVSLRDRVSSGGESEQDNIVQVPISVIISDENDNPPEFRNVPYEAEVQENAPVGVTIFNKILVIDKDISGDDLDISCVAQNQSLEACSKFKIEILERNLNKLRAAIVLDGELNYNQRMIYHFQLEATDGVHKSTTNFEVRVKDVQDKAPIFQGSLSAIIDEDSPINTLVLKVQAKDGDTGEPRKIVYDLLTNPMDYFLLDERTGELRTAKPLDRETLPDSTGLITLSIRARELIDGIPGSDDLTTAISQATVTIRDVNDSPPTFNKKEYSVSLPENTPPGTPLTLDMNVTDRDVGINSKFSLRLQDEFADKFEVEPKFVTGFSQVNVRVGQKTFDYENRNDRKFIVQIIAEETDTNPKLSSTATITISVVDANDNRPTFSEQSYSATVSESAEPGQYITTITANDKDSGSFGEAGIRYSLSGTGAELFNVNERTGTITLADCHNISNNSVDSRRKRDTENDYQIETTNKRVNITHDGQSGLINIDIDAEPNVEYTVVNQNKLNKLTKKNMTSLSYLNTCLDYETISTYFLSYRATDDNGKGQTSVVSLRISVTDANDSPPICESPYYRASIDEGSHLFDSNLIIKARDADTTSDISYKIIGTPLIESLFEIDKRTGQITIKRNASIDVTHLKTDILVFSVEASDGIFSTNCGINITVRDVNNHAPRFLSNYYVSDVAENAEIGTSVEKLTAEDLDSGINAELKYRIQHGSFDDFRIDENSGEIFVSRKLDYDRRNTYQIEVLASDSGTPSLTGTATLTISVINSNDKDPYFTPTTQRADVREDAPIGTVVHNLVAIDPDVATFDALQFAATEPITAIDKDGKEVLNVDEFRDYFSINRNGKVVVNKKLNRDLFAVLGITVLVTDSTAPTIQQGNGSLVISIIDINEMPPKFHLPWTVENPLIKLQIAEEQPIGSVLTTLQAYDEDSTIGEFDISENPYFEINKTTGVITTKARLDYETLKEVKFIATVTDTGIPQLKSTANVSVDLINLNDNEPHFSEKEYQFNITENSPRGTVVGKVEAADGDIGAFGEVTYSLMGELRKFFLIDSYTGSIMVANSSILDREKVSQIVLTAIAEDKAPLNLQKSTSATIYINVLDVNDNAPIFTQDTYTSTIAENAALNPPAALLQVKADDLDEGLFGDVRYFIISGNDQDLFKLDSHSGIVYPAQSLQGKKGKYELKVQARDTQGSGTFESTARVLIDVQGVNQHRPVFVIPALSNATVEIPGDIVKEGYLIMTVKATDNDTDENGRVSYHLQINNRNVQNTDEFEMNEVTGELKTRTELHRLNQSNYDLILVANDHGSPSQFETLQFLSVILVDANENRPEFPNSLNPYKISINENNGRNERVGKIQAITKNKHNKDIYYYMLLGNEDGAFYVDKTTGDIYTNKSLDREIVESYTLYILASSKQDLHISEDERASFAVKTLDRDSTVAKVFVEVLDVNDNEPVFEKNVYFAGINAKSSINNHIVIVNATDKDYGKNAKIEYMIVASNLYKFGATKSTGSIVPSPFSISPEGRITTTAFMAEYNQDRFELEVVAKEIEPPERSTKARVYVWIFDSTQLIRVILSQPPTEVNQKQDEIIAELKNATQHRIVVDEIRYHVDSLGRIRRDWCDLYFHAVNKKTQQIAPVDDILRSIDDNYDYLRDYYSKYSIENVVPAYMAAGLEEEFDLALAGLVALLIVLFVGVITFIVLCCCLKHWNLSVPVENRRKDALIKKQIIEDLNTTENPLWIEQKLKLYEEQELTMQVFSEPEQVSNSDGTPAPSDLRDCVEHSHPVDNTYATIQPRNMDGHQISDFADYATLRNNRAPSMYEFTGSTFQAPIREGDDAVAELI